MYSTVIYLILLISIQNCGRTAARKGKPPEVDESIRTHFKIPAGTKPFKMSCPIRNADPDDGIMVRWSKDDEEISSADWTSSPYRLLNGNVDLKIRNPQVSDSGNYRCMLVNGFGHKKVEFTLQVYDANTVRKEQPSESIVLSDHGSSPIWFDRDAIDAAVKRPLRLTRGKRLELRCPASGNPLPKIYWSKNGNRISMELTNPTSAKFVIDNVDVDDSGMYACRLENTYGSLEADFRVLVSHADDDLIHANELIHGEDEGSEATSSAAAAHGSSSNYDTVPSSGSFGSKVLLPPKSGADGIDGLLLSSVASLPQPIIDQPYNTTVRAGHTAQFQCKVQWRKDAPTIRWLRKIENPALVKATQPNATILNINEMHLLVLDQQQQQEPAASDKTSDGGRGFLNKLLIPNVQPPDAGRYFCVVTNAAGQFVFRSAYLEVAEGGRFPPFATSMNVLIAVIIVVVLTLVTFAVVWLCYNSGAESSVKSISLAAPHQFSSTSSTNSSTSSSSTANGKCAQQQQQLNGTALITTDSAVTDTLTNPSMFVNSGGAGGNCDPVSAMRHAVFNETAAQPFAQQPLHDSLQQQQPPPPPPPPQIPLPPAPAPQSLIVPNNTPATVISADTQQNLLYQRHQQQMYQQQQFYHHQQQQQQLLFDNNFTHHSQMQLHHDVSSPLLGGHHYRQMHQLQNGNISIGELLYPSSVTLDRRYLSQQQRMASHQQHILHRTKAEDEMSRLSSHIYDILAANSPLPPQSPTPMRRLQQQQQTQQHQHSDSNNNLNQQQHHHQQKITSADWTCRKYAPLSAPAPPLSVPPPRSQHLIVTSAAPNTSQGDTSGTENNCFSANFAKFSQPQSLATIPSRLYHEQLLQQQQQRRQHAEICVGDGTGLRNID